MTASLAARVTAAPRARQRKRWPSASDGGTDDAALHGTRPRRPQSDGNMTHSSGNGSDAPPPRARTYRRHAGSPPHRGPCSGSDPRRGAVLALALSVAGSSPAGLARDEVAYAVHPLEDIMATVEFAALDAAEAEGLDNVEVRVTPLDARLKPAACDQPLEIVRSHAGRVLGPVSYGVRCAGPKPWTLYLRARVSAALTVPVLVRSLPRGSIINENDLKFVERRVIQQANDLIVDADMAIGMELRRPLPAGSELRYGQVERPQVVSRGQVVTLIAGGSGFEVRMQGKAMGSGAAGDRLLVTNLRSGRRVEGVILADGSVAIP